MEAMGEIEPTRQAIRLFTEFKLPYPVSSIRKYQWGWWPHTKQPDIDKLLRALLDAMTGIVWVDDSQVCYCVANKVYAWQGSPGAVVVVDFMNDEALHNLGLRQQNVQNVLDSL